VGATLDGRERVALGFFGVVPQLKESLEAVLALVTVVNTLSFAEELSGRFGKTEMSSKSLIIRPPDPLACLAED